VGHPKNKKKKVDRPTKPVKITTKTFLFLVVGPFDEYP